MTKFLTVSCVIFLSLFSFGAQASENFGIAATVNKDAISEADLNNRMKLIFASSGLENTKSNRSKIRPQALNGLIEEQLKLQEAGNQNVIITPEDVDTGFAAIAAQNNFTSEQFIKVMQQQGIPKSTLFNQIKSQIAWTKVVTKVLRPKVDVSENDINAKMDRIKENVGKIEYQAFEIFLPIPSSQDEIKIKELADKLIQEIKSGRASFSAMASQFSRAPEAANGGAMGWVQDGELSQELDLVLKSLSEGQISPPIRDLSGFHILTVTKKRTVSGKNLPTQDEVLSSIGLERLDRLQTRYLSDLRSSAFIDMRN